MNKTVWLIAAAQFMVIGISSAAPAQTQQVKDYSYFLERLIDLDALPVLSKGIQCKQFSSYDRASRYDEATGKYIKWDANGDRGQYISVDPQTGEALMAQMEAPGCIWRIWSANP
ncbi:MAG: hypothetical protein ACYTF1_03260, partial [Planctomycetota bacterium]